MKLIFISIHLSIPLNWCIVSGFVNHKLSSTFGGNYQLFDLTSQWSLRFVNSNHWYLSHEDAPLWHFSFIQHVICMDLLVLTLDTILLYQTMCQFYFHAKTGWVSPLRFHHTNMFNYFWLIQQFLFLAQSTPHNFPPSIASSN